MVPSFRIILWTLHLILLVQAARSGCLHIPAILESLLATLVLVLWEAQRWEIRRAREAIAATLKAAEEAAGKLAYYQARAAVAEALVKAQAAHNQAMAVATEAWEAATRRETQDGQRLEALADLAPAETQGRKA